MTDKVAAEVCEKEFVRLCESRRIEHVVGKMTKLEKAIYSARKTSIIRAMTRGDLIIGPDGNPAYTPPGGKPITFHRATGATLMAQDGFGPNHDVARVTAVAEELTKSTPGDLAKLEIEDFGIVADITNFLLGR